MKAEKFCQALKFVSHAMAIKDIRYYLNGVCFEFTLDGLCMVATDGHRMAVCTVLSPDESIPVGAQIIVPADGVKIMLTFLKGLVHNVVLSFDAEKKTLNLKCGQVDLNFQPVEGKFPDWRRVDPQSTNPGRQPTPRIGLNADYIAAAFKACGALASKHGGCTLDLYDEHSCALVRPGRDPEGLRDPRTIVMPMRLDRIC